MSLAAAVLPVCLFCGQRIRLWKRGCGRIRRIKRRGEMFSSVPAEILGLVAGWGFLLIVAAFCFPIRSSYQKPIGKGKIVTAAAVSSIVLVLGIGALSNLFLSWEKAGPSFLLWLTGIREA